MDNQDKKQDNVPFLRVESGSLNHAPMKPATKQEVAVLGRAVSECMLSNSVGTIIGVAIGTYLGLKRKNLRPFVVAISFGTVADLFYGYTNNCRRLLDDFDRAKRSLPKDQQESVGLKNMKTVGKDGDSQ